MKELKKQWKNGEFGRCYLFYGAEAYLLKEYEQALTKALLPEGAEMMNHDIFEEKRATAAAIMDAAETFPFLNDKRLVTVRNSEFFQKSGRKEEGERLKEYLADLPESVCLLFIEDKVEKTSALYKALVKHGQAVEFKKLTEKDLGTWIKKMCRDHGMQMSESVLGLFLQTVDHDMENIEGELLKLIAYKGEETEIKAQVAFYKEHRRIFQYGTFRRLSDGEKTVWQVSDGQTHITGLFHKLVHAAPGYERLRVVGLDKNRVYHVVSREQSLRIGLFGELIKHVAPVSLSPHGVVLRTVDHRMTMPDGGEDFTASGSALHTGVMLKPLFGGGGYTTDQRTQGDFGSNVYLIKEVPLHEGTEHKK
jgi:hypothetical protein